MPTSRISFRKGAESALHARDHIGVQDFVLLEDYRSEDAFLENLQKRFKSNLIYVSTSARIKWLGPFGGCNMQELL